MIDMRLTTLSDGEFDLKMTNGRFEFATDGTEVAQHALMRLRKFNGESVTDNENETGTRWYEVIFDHSKSRAEKELELKSRILGTTGVIKILTFSYEQALDQVNITGSVQTEWGEADISEDITLL